MLFFPFQSQPILESGAVELLCGLTQSENPALRVNGIWALMVCFTLFYNSSLVKRMGLLSKLKLKNVLFEMSKLCFLINVAILAQFSNDLGPRTLSIQLLDLNISVWPLCTTVLLFIIKKSRHRECFGGSVG